MKFLIYYDNLINIQGCIQKFPDWVDNEINNNKHSLRNNKKDYDGKTHYTDSQNSDITAPSGTELYHLQFSLQAASPETFGYIRTFSFIYCRGAPYWSLHALKGCQPTKYQRTLIGFCYRTGRGCLATQPEAERTV
jgi:hypothetical protein